MRVVWLFPCTISNESDVAVFPCTISNENGVAVSLCAAVAAGCLSYVNAPVNRAALSKMAEPDKQGQCGKFTPLAF